jgi:CheY-specific phosphatase CheX
MNNKDKQIHHEISSIFKDMGKELFAHYHLEYADSADELRTLSASHSYMSSLSAAGEGIKILCFILFNEETARAIFPGKPEDANEESLKDLCGELNNQLVGKVKNKLLAYDCRLSLGLPTHVTGKHLTNSTIAGADQTQFAYRSPKGELTIKAFTLIHSDFTMLDAPNEALTGAAEEGFLSFF